jgi:formate hydrogenlyase transcriptional activator
MAAVSPIRDNKSGILAGDALASRYETLIRLSQAIGVSRDPDKVFDSLAGELRRVVQFDCIWISLLDQDSNKFRHRLIDLENCSGAAPDWELPADEKLMSWVYEHQKPVVTAADQLDPRFERLRTALRERKIRSICTLPLTTAQQKLGAISVGSKHLETYSADEIRFLSLVADHVALAVHSALSCSALEKASKEAEKNCRRLQLLLDLTNRITSNLELRELLRSILANIREVMQYDLVMITLPDKETGKLHIYSVDFPRGKGFAKEGLLFSPRENDPARRAFSTLKPVVVDKVDPSELPPEVVELAVAEGVKSHCVIPLVNRGRALGLLTIGRTAEGTYAPEDIEFLSQAAGQIAIAVENALAYSEMRELKEQLAKEKLYLEDEIRSEMNFAQIIGKSPALRKVLQRVEIVAPTDSTVLIYGETGTGKELIARAIHDLSPRRAKAFVKLNCAAIPTGLLESELFGHEKGAFTGAIAQRIGRFEVADGGTIFLDEIGEIPLELQTKLLRVLQEREFERLGSSRTLRTDARLIAATNRDLDAMVSEQKFRSDLFFRINVFPLHVPPLRERPEDIPLLVRHFTQQLARRMQKAIDTIPSAAMDALCRYHWPGNIRELQNVIERAVILSAGPKLDLDVADLKPSQASRVQEEVAPPGSDRGGALRRVMDETERQQILKALAQCNGVVAGPRGAAALLGMKRSTLQLRMRKLGIRQRFA